MAKIITMKVLIIGAGFGGLKLARGLNNKKGIEVILIDRFNFHQFQPLFYQVASASLDASDISFPLRKVFHKSENVRYRMANVNAINQQQHKVKTDIGDFDYDILVLATGADTNFFGNEIMKANAFPMKSTLEALQLRYRILRNFEDAVSAKDDMDLQRFLNIVVVGGGPTGVELSGAIADMRRFVLPKDYPELDFSKMNIYLMEGTAKTLGAMSEKSSIDSKDYLERLGVRVMTNTILKEYDGKTAVTQDGQKIETAMVIWAAGIKGNVPDGINPDLITRGNRINVDRYCKAIGSNNVYAIGDVAYMEEPAYPKGHPQVSPVAIQQGNLLAKNILAMVKQNKNLQEFKYFDKGSMATVGRNLAVVDLPKPKLHFKGFIAWLMWMGLHLIVLVGVKNRLSIFANWVYNYFTRDQNLRLIFKIFDKKK
jgi:NADH dehydrogenase